MEAKLVQLEHMQICHDQFYNSEINFVSSKSEDYCFLFIDAEVEDSCREKQLQP